VIGLVILFVVAGVVPTVLVFGALLTGRVDWHPDDIRTGFVNGHPVELPTTGETDG
jgi:hypothetical protein